LFGTWNTLPAKLRALLPPEVDGLYAQANAFGRYGARGESTAARRVPTLDGADSALAGDQLPFALVTRGDSATAMALPLIDETDRLRGLLIGTGGARRRTGWYPLPMAGPRWAAIL